MSTLNDEFSSGLNEFFAAAGTAASINGVEVPVVDDSVSYEQVLTPGGVLETPALTLFVANPTVVVPSVGDVVRYKTRTYRVISITEDAVSYRLSLGNLEK